MDVWNGHRLWRELVTGAAMARPARRRRQMVRARQRIPSLSGCLPGIRFLSFLSTRVCLLSEDCCQGLQFGIRGFVIILLVSFRHLRFHRDRPVQQLPCVPFGPYFCKQTTLHTSTQTLTLRAVEELKEEVFLSFLWARSSMVYSLQFGSHCSLYWFSVVVEERTLDSSDSSLLFSFWIFLVLSFGNVSALSLSQVSSSELHWLLLPLIPLVLSFCWSACSSSVLCFFFTSVASFKYPTVSSSLCRPSCSCSLEKLYWVEGVFRISRTSSATLIVSQFDGFSKKFKRMIPLHQKSGVLKS